MFYFLIYLIYLYLRSCLNILETICYILIICYTYVHIYFIFIYLYRYIFY